MRKTSTVRNKFSEKGQYSNEKRSVHSENKFIQKDQHSKNEFSEKDQYSQTKSVQ